MRAWLAGASARARSLVRGVVRRKAVEAEVSEEFRHHLALRTEDLIRRGVAPREAARRARLEFGNVEGLREDARASRGLRFIDGLGFSWLDVKLGVRMLAKYPGLSLVSVFGMSIAIAIGAGGFGLVYVLIDAPLPLDEGERVVALQNVDSRIPGSPERRTLHDFILWREELRSVRDLSATLDRRHSLVVEGRGSDVVTVAHMTASGFRVARVAPVLGRPLLDDDERPGAPPVLVIGYDAWQRRFGRDPTIVGRQVRLGAVAHTVVGVMPEGFHFPIDHEYWAPLRLDPTAVEVGGGPELFLFGRLADGVSLDRAQAELTTVGSRLAAEHPDTHAHLRPTIRPYIHPFAGIESPARAWLVRSVQLGLSLLLVVVAVNVAILVYARTAARMGEITVRTALGASRRRIATQLFAEALVVTAIAAAVGALIAVAAFDILRDLLTGGGAQMPFWVRFRVSPAMVLYVAGLTVLAAAIVGVVPALKATGSAIQGRLQQLSTKGSRMQLGRTWTTLIVVQVAVAVAVLPYALWGGTSLARGAAAEPDYPVAEFVHAALSVDLDDAAVASDPPAAQSSGDAAAADPAEQRRIDDDVRAARFAANVAEVVRRLRAEPAVAGVAYATRYPGTESVGEFEVDGTGRRSWTWASGVDVDLFDVFDVRVLAGRGFVPADATTGSNVALVDRTFAEEIAPGGRAIGRRVRRIERATDGSGRTETGPWLEIVGVVETFVPPPPFERNGAPRIYRPLALADAGPSIHLAVRVRPDTPPATFLGRIRAIATAVDPEIRLTQQTAAEEGRLLRKGFLSLALLIGAITGSVLLLSAAGIYAMLSFTVASRRREIGIRSALGAAPRTVLAAIFKRAALQLGAGVAGGLLLAEAVPRVQGGSFFAGDGAWILLPIIATLVAVGLIAVIGPARRGLAIQPTEALRED
jgi:putative ABC transport system permease protein